MEELVSIIIPTYKRSDYLLQTIDSVLAQTYSPIEIIVVDDNGLGTKYQIETQEKLLNLIDDGKIIYIPHEKNKNGSAARNTGFRASKGKYINFLDDDDELMPQKIEMQVKRLINTDDIVGATYCNKITVRLQSLTNRKVKENKYYSQEGSLLLDYILAKCTFGTSQILFKRKVIENLHGFDESYLRHQDLELMTRFFGKYELLCTSPNIPLVTYDLSKDRGNVLSCEKDFKNKQKYITDFKEFFVNKNILKEVSHHIWFCCAASALLNRNYTIFRRAFKSIPNKISVVEMLSLFKRFLIGLIIK